MKIITFPDKSEQHLSEEGDEEYPPIPKLPSKALLAAMTPDNAAAEKAAFTAAEARLEAIDKARAATLAAAKKAGYPITTRRVGKREA